MYIMGDYHGIPVMHVNDPLCTYTQHPQQCKQHTTTSSMIVIHKTNMHTHTHAYIRVLITTNTLYAWSR